MSCDPVCIRRNSVCKFYRQVTGITTGLSCATQVANAFLLSFDREIARTLASNLWLHKRFVDDVLIVSTQYNRCELLDICNNWCPGIVVTNDELQTDTATTFLDLSITLSNGKFNYRTFRKPLNSYAYLPWSSNHSLASRRGIICTECIRLLTTNRFEHTYHSELLFFAKKLCDRGFPHDLVFVTFTRYPWSEKRGLLKKKNSARLSVVPFKLVWTPALKYLSFGSIVGLHLDSLDADIRNRIKVVMCFMSAANLFRLRYNRFL